MDKVINHLVSRYILYPALLPHLLNVNVASRKGLGTSEGIRLATNFHRKCSINYNTYYILKCDISKFFASINHNILKEKLKRQIKDKDSLKIVFDIIDSEENGLSIGAMTSQVLAIFEILFKWDKIFLAKEKLTLNKKTRIYKNTNNFVFLGRKKDGNYARYRNVRRKLRKKLHLYRIGKTSLAGMANSIICYENLCKKR